MDKTQGDLEQLTQLVRELLARVERLEQAAGITRGTHVSVQSAAETHEADLARRAQPDLESRIGSQWLNRIGIVAVLVGVSFFLKYAFESALIGPLGRVWLGAFLGLATIIGSEWFRRHNYRVFSFSLKALGLGVLYLSIWAAFQVYDLIIWAGAFAAMMAVTIFTAILALWQDAEILALFALVGGFLTPLLLYTNTNREIELFTYLSLLNCATLSLSVLRRWQRLVLVSLASTAVLFFVWFANFYRPDELGSTLAFTTTFFVIFGIAPVLEHRFSVDSVRWHVALVSSLLNAVFFFSELYVMLIQHDSDALAGVLLVIGVAYVAISRFFASPNPAILRLRGLHVAIGIALITLAIAIYFQAQWISLGWFVESAILIAIGFRQKLPFLRWLGLAVLAAAIGKVFFVDIWQLERGYRILSFITLGLLLLVVSFLYQRDWLKQFTSRI